MKKETSKQSPKKAKRLTIYDLARLADVSPGTVSRVLNNRDKVHPQTREKVLELAHKIGLNPQSSVRNREVAIITEPSFQDRIGGYSASLSAFTTFNLSGKNVGVLLPENPVEMLPHYYLDGAITVSAEKEILELLKSVEKRIPVVYMDHFEATAEQYTVNSDHYRSGELAAEHFLEHGRSKLAFIGNDCPPNRVRMEGYTAVMKKAGIEPNPRLLQLDPEGSLAYTSLTRALRNGADALFVPGSSMQAVEAMHVLQYVMRKEVPKDVSVIGGENEGVSIFQNPPLTTVAEPLRDMARLAADLIIKLADGVEVEPRHYTLPVKLIVRESV
ncbi:LacI family DNA-binding transcriptional regulator [Ruficoccus amylovorans]|uniref:LacI family DNA-binding transcriptional regulator n=1 Tax=Ruficoccus amylovorans TaxID=1804625 RepID=A0A842HIB2_9BACT|nr:LacI family DNA-binding transcriptional regulator [Ruficoccus amylovorans]MBC2594961.1 LacI family DNA-binding transcriptional regulator [Ruficoccus amylovorans]